MAASLSVAEAELCGEGGRKEGGGNWELPWQRVGTPSHALCSDRWGVNSFALWTCLFPKPRDPKGFTAPPCLPASLSYSLTLSLFGSLISFMLY